MFNDLIVSGVGKKETIRPWTIVVSAIGEAAILFTLVLIPLFYTQALPKEMLTTFLVAPAPPPPPPASVAPIKYMEHFVQMNKMVVPTVIPKNIEILKEEVAPPQVAGVTGGVFGGVPGGQAGGVLGGIIGGTGTNMSRLPQKRLRHYASE